MQVLPVGPEALLVDLDGHPDVLGAVAAVGAALRDARERGELPGVVDVVPAARTVLVTAPGDREALREVRALLASVDTAAVPDRAEAGSVELAVHYDGEDLELVARDAGCSVDEVVTLHTGATLTVAFGGFAPGFAYLSGLPAPLQQPRLDTPRPRIPAGAVGVAGEFGGVYPRASPGGWRLLGRLTEDAPVLFDPHRDPPALLQPGTTVRFRDAG
ncbi:5-oxoprolinase subunit B family protein [Actinomycetospora cinnamomea]|uniref:KipI family sensor histidine kinase inhibitor n=1 Tax=Actinomycetospora cinnamomea TaxID=663609 RepID=A0A2U1ECQ3_9PSEU|nr:allophanate hydrolase subunit 1 [Actinomycetospora cinnamomea]PVY97711.1 KipI family sensor histidine kinase inhibitor [Actinomycetospora cinnamomea]